MSYLERIGARRFAPGPGVYAPVPKKGKERFWFVIKTHFRRLVGVNLLCTLFCLPLITIPAAVSGLTRVIMRLVRDGTCDLWTDFWEEFKSGFWQKLIIWLVVLISPISISCLPSLLGIDTGGSMLLMIFGILSFWLFSYWFVLMSILDVPPLANLKNAAILMVVEWKKSLLLLATVGIVYICCIMLPVFCLPLMMFGVFSVTVLGSCLMLIEPIQVRLICTRVEDDDMGT